VQFFAGLESNGLARSDAYFGAGSRVAADASLARANAEDAKSAKFDAISGSQGLLEPLEDGIHS